MQHVLLTHLLMVWLCLVGTECKYQVAFGTRPSDRASRQRCLVSTNDALQHNRCSGSGFLFLACVIFQLQTTMWLRPWGVAKGNMYSWFLHIYIYIFFKITTYTYIYIYIFHGLDPVMTMHVREFSLRRANPNFGSFSVPFLLLGWRPLQKTNILDDCPISS